MRSIQTCAQPSFYLASRLQLPFCMRDKHNHTLPFKKLLHSSKTPLLFTSVFVSLFLLSSSTAWADVNLREGSFLTATSEVRVGRFLLTRKYNSRSMTVGAFGFGWQSALDQTLTDPKGLKITRDKDTHLVTEIERRSVTRNRAWHYVYHNRDLVEVLLGKMVLVRYRYDDVHNLTEIIYPDGSNEKISYLTDEDQVKSYQDNKRCLENYTYNQQQWGAVLQSRTSVERRCPASSSNPKTRMLTYEFWMKKQKNGASLLLKAQIISQKKKVNLNFDRVSGFYTAGEN